MPLHRAVTPHCPRTVSTVFFTPSGPKNRAPSPEAMSASPEAITASTEASPDSTEAITDSTETSPDSTETSPDSTEASPDSTETSPDSTEAITASTEASPASPDGKADFAASTEENAVYAVAMSSFGSPFTSFAPGWSATVSYCKCQCASSRPAGAIKSGMKPGWEPLLQGDVAIRRRRCINQPRVGARNEHLPWGNAPSRHTPTGFHHRRVFAGGCDSTRSG